MSKSIIERSNHIKTPNTPISPLVGLIHTIINDTAKNGAKNFKYGILLPLFVLVLSEIHPKKTPFIAFKMAYIVNAHKMYIDGRLRGTKTKTLGYTGNYINIISIKTSTTKTEDVYIDISVIE